MIYAILNIFKISLSMVLINNSQAVIFLLCHIKIVSFKLAIYILQILKMLLTYFSYYVKVVKIT